MKEILPYTSGRQTSTTTEYGGVERFGGEGDRKPGLEGHENSRGSRIPKARELV